ncbi:hypothetical protein [Pseudonocardia halophobica]|nr:hypothetical protein [Pseudonocardia halophobica]
MPHLSPRPTDHPDWEAVLAAQHGLVTAGQLLRDFGLTQKHLLNQLDAGRWQRVLPRVYATFTGPLPEEARLRAALLYGGASAVLSHRTAAERWGLMPPQPGPVHITVRYGCSAVSQRPHVVVHRSRAHAHIVVGTDPPVTGRADAAIDVAVEEPTARAARQRLTDLIGTGRVGAGTVWRRLQQRPPRRYRKALDEAVRLIAGGVQSVLEECYAVDVEQAHGLPAGRRQVPALVDGRTLYEDVTYDDAGVPLTVRLDGRTHLQPETALRDRRRDNAAELAGRSRLVFGWVEVSSRPCQVAAEVSAVLRRYRRDLGGSTCFRCSEGVVSAK